MPSWFARAQARIPGGVNSPGARSARSAASRSSSPVRTARTSSTPTVASTSTTCSRGARRSSATRIPRSSKRCSTPRPTARRSARRRREVELAEAICDASRRWRRSASCRRAPEAAMTAVRLARGATGRAKIVKFAGCYHGHADALLAQAGSGVATLGLPGSAGVTPGTVADTIVVPYNDLAALDAALGRARSRHRGDPRRSRSPRTWASSRPADGFLKGLRKRCTRIGALLVIDEVITGFRVGLGGAQARFAITPDLSIFGKVVGGGLPLAALGGPAALMDELAPLGPVYQAGHALGEPARDRRRPRGARAPRRRHLRRARTDRRSARRRSRRRVHRRGRRRAGHARVHARRRVLRAGAGAQLRGSARRRSRALRERSSTACSTAACTSRRAATRRCSRASPTPTPTSTGRSPPPRRA